MGTTKEETDLDEKSACSFQGLENFLSQAMKKINANQEKELCRYLPDLSRGGHMHHFTMRKMKTENTNGFIKLLNEYILNPESPQILPPKKRAPRKAKERLMNFTESDFKKMLEIAKLAGDEEMVSKLTPKKSLKQAQRELIYSIQSERIDVELWNLYIDSLRQRNESLLNPENDFDY